MSSALSLSARPELPRPSRRRLVVFWVVAVALVALLLGETLADRPTYLLIPITVWGGWGMSADVPGHSIHTLMVSLLYWAVIAGVLVQLRRPEGQIGGAWTYGVVAIVTLLVMLGLGAVPAEALPILTGVLVFAALAFLAHPSPLRAKFRPVERPSLLLAGLVAVAAVPLLFFSVDSFAIHAASGPGDEHFEFGHWAFMGIYPVVALLVGAAAAVKVSGWRLPGWIAGVLVLGHGLVSLFAPAASALSTTWSVLAIAWGIALIGAVEFEARRRSDVAELGGGQCSPDGQRSPRRSSP
jgi:hypothetical protein